MLAAIGNEAGVALQRTPLFTEVERMFLNVMRAIVAMVDASHSGHAFDPAPIEALLTLHAHGEVAPLVACGAAVQ